MLKTRLAIARRLGAPPTARQRGMSLVELMVGIAVGLFVVAGATAIVGGQLGDTRRLLAETQLQQDLRAAADIIVRDLRRAGYTTSGQVFVDGDGSGPSQQNTAIGMTPTTPDETVDTVTYSYVRAVNQTGPFGFRKSGAVIQSYLGAGPGWQDLTDSRILSVQDFSITPRIVASTTVPCPKNCPDGTTACWPTISVRELDISITASSKADANVVRSFSATVRLRNDRVDYNAAGGLLCPA